MGTYMGRCVCVLSFTEQKPSYREDLPASVRKRRGGEGERSSMCLLPGPGCQGRRTKDVIRRDEMMGTGGKTNQGEEPRTRTKDEGRRTRVEGRRRGEDEGQCCAARRRARGYLHK